MKQKEYMIKRKKIYFSHHFPYVFGYLQTCLLYLYERHQLF